MPVFRVCLWLLLALLALPACAHDTVYRCVDAHGSPVFSDQPCAALAATPVQPAATPDAAASPGGAPPLRGCAASVAELRQRVIAAFAARDPNQLAGLMLWHGYTRHAAIGDIRTLDDLVRAPLVSIHLGDTGADESPSAAGPADDASSLQVRTGGADGRSMRFAIEHRAGCLWLRFAS